MWRFLKRLMKVFLWSVGVLVALFVVVAIFVGPSEEEQKETAEAPVARSKSEPVESVNRKPAAASTPIATGLPETAERPLIDPSQQTYKVVKEQDHSFGNRVRVTLEIEAPQAERDEEVIGAMMVAAVDRHRKDWPHAVTARLWKSYGKDQVIHNRITYATDGCGWTGDKCTGSPWSDLHRGAFPERWTHWGQPTDEEKKASEEKACRQDLQCWGDKHAMEATFACQPLIERRAKYDYQWTDGWLGTKLPRFRWQDRKAGTLSYTGDKIKFQNGFGAWQHAVYWCHFDPAKKTASVEVYAK